jgi:hypothetical protein
MFESWKQDIPVLSKGTAILLLILNIFIPALGTFLMACIGPEFKSSQLIVAILQFLLAGLLIGWIWSVWWGILVVEKST